MNMPWSPCYKCLKYTEEICCHHDEGSRMTETVADYIPLEKEMATHSSILAWRIPWTEETDRLQSIGLKRVKYD